MSLRGAAEVRRHLPLGGRRCGRQRCAGRRRPRFGKEVAVLPTSIDTTCYLPTTAGPADPPTIAWIGSPENLIYLGLIRPALARLTSGTRL